MIENKIVGLGGAYIDAKIQFPSLGIPIDNAELPNFLDNHPEAQLYAGGSIPNILTAFIKLSDYCVSRSTLSSSKF